jgi:hypothetical protein
MYTNGFPRRAVSFRLRWRPASLSRAGNWDAFLRHLAQLTGQPFYHVASANGDFPTGDPKASTAFDPFANSDACKSSL